MRKKRLAGMAFLALSICSGAFLLSAFGIGGGKQHEAEPVKKGSMRTIANADHIVVLGDGVVAEQGSPEFLSEYDSIFARMTAQQLISQNWRM